MSAIFNDPNFWYAVAFLLFMIGLSPIIFRKAVLALKTYQEAIAHQFKDVDEIYEEATQYLKDQKEAEKNLTATLMKMQDSMTTEINEITQEIELTFQKKVRQKEHMLQHHIEHIKGKAWEKVVNTTVQATASVTHQYVAAHFSDEMDATFIDKELTSFGASAQEQK